MRRIYTMGPMNTGKNDPISPFGVGIRQAERENEQESGISFQQQRTSAGRSYFYTALSAADGGTAAALRTGMKVVNNTTPHATKNRSMVLTHGKENAAPSAFQSAL